MAAKRAEPYAQIGEAEPAAGVVAAASALHRSPSDKSFVPYRGPVTAGQMTGRTPSSHAGSSGVADQEHGPGPWDPMGAGADGHSVGVPSHQDDDEVAVPEAAFVRRPSSTATSYFPARPPPGQAQNELKVVNRSNGWFPPQSGQVAPQGSGAL